jgi:hypothetical protein
MLLDDSVSEFNRVYSLFLSPWLYSPLDLGRFFSLLILYSVGRTHWTGDQPISRPLPTHRTTQTQNNRTQTSMSRVGFESTNPAFEYSSSHRRRGRCDNRLCPRRMLIHTLLILISTSKLWNRQSDNDHKQSRIKLAYFSLKLACPSHSRTSQVSVSAGSIPIHLFRYPGIRHTE